MSVLLSVLLTALCTYLAVLDSSLDTAVATPAVYECKHKQFHSQLQNANVPRRARTYKAQLDGEDAETEQSIKFKFKSALLSCTPCW